MEQKEVGTIGSKIELIQRHVEMLRTIVENQPIGIIKLAEMFNYPRHKVRYSLRILEEEGLIEPSSEGAVATIKLGKYLEELKTSLISTVDLIGEVEKSLK